MSKRFGRNQKRKLQGRIKDLQHSLEYTDRMLESELSKSPRVQAEAFYHVFDTTSINPLDCIEGDIPNRDVKVDKLPLHQLQTEVYKDNNPFVKELEQMLMVKSYLSDGTVAYRYSEALLKSMDKDSLKYYLTTHIADLLIDSLRSCK